MGWPRTKLGGSAEPSAAERAGCVACGRLGTLTVPAQIGDDPVRLCVGVVDCRLHAQKVGIYCA